MRGALHQTSFNHFISLSISYFKHKVEIIAIGYVYGSVGFTV